jgi:hypothetical protein
MKRHIPQPVRVDDRIRPPCSVGFMQRVVRASPRKIELVVLLYPVVQPPGRGTPHIRRHPWATVGPDHVPRANMRAPTWQETAETLPTSDAPKQGLIRHMADMRRCGAIEMVGRATGCRRTTSRARSRRRLGSRLRERAARPAGNLCPA